MPRLIDPGPPAAPMTIAEAAEALAAIGFDPEAEGAWDAAAPILARLSANRDILAERAIAELKEGAQREAAHHYGPQVIMLHRPDRGHWFLRANLWPAADDPLLRASGRSAFFYDLPHDHNFSFLTVGHHGPGYESDYWEIGEEAFAGLPGDPVALRFTGRRRLEQGQMMLYRAHRDVHDQKPPTAFSVTLNLMESSGREPWRNQYRFDPTAGRIEGTINGTAIEGLIALAAHLGGGDGRDLVEHLARRHPVDRIRFGAVRALAGAAATADERLAVLDAAARRRDPPVATMAAHALADAPAILAWAARAPSASEPSSLVIG